MYTKYTFWRSLNHRITSVIRGKKIDFRLTLEQFEQLRKTFVYLLAINCQSIIEATGTTLFKVTPKALLLYCITRLTRQRNS